MYRTGQEREMRTLIESDVPGPLATVAKGLATVLCAVLLLVINSRVSRGQIPEPPLPVDPRPLSELLSATDKTLIADSKNPKAVIEAYLKISEAHLQAAFNAIGSGNHISAEKELDVYNKAIAAAGKAAFALQEGKRNASKRIEQTLYKQIKTLESIERLFPSDRERFAEAALKQSKQLRVQALNEAFASGEVLKDPKEEKKPKSEPLIRDGAPNQQNGNGAPHRDQNRRLDRGSVLRGFHLSTSVAPAATRYLISADVVAQMRGDYLTEEEDDHVREAQAPDARAKVFMKIADRRLNAIVTPPAPAADKKEQKKLDEEEREWGALPKVSKDELLRHYARAIAECMAKLEDAYERNPKSSALPKALSVLREATDKHLETLRRLKPDMKTESELAAISTAVYEAETANKGAREGLK
jgi:hypothetical protein